MGPPTPLALAAVFSACAVLAAAATIDPRIISGQDVKMGKVKQDSYVSWESL